MFDPVDEGLLPTSIRPGRITVSAADDPRVLTNADLASITLTGTPPRERLLLTFADPDLLCALTRDHLNEPLTNR